MKQYDFDEAEKTFLKLCERHGIKIIKDGTGQFIMDGKPFDPIEELKREMEFDKKYYDIQ